MNYSLLASVRLVGVSLVCVNSTYEAQGSPPSSINNSKFVIFSLHGQEIEDCSVAQTFARTGK
jgi:hypothetical protein